MADTLLNEVMYNEVLTSDGYVVDLLCVLLIA